MINILDGWLVGSLPDDTGREWPVVQRRQESARGPLRPATPQLILHTTETDSYIQRLRFPSQWQCGEGQIGQHIKLGLSGDSVNNWDVWAQQIEMVGHSKLAKWLPEEGTLGPTVALTAWLHKTERIRTGLKRPDGQSWPVVLDKGPQAVEAYYRRHAGLWPEEPGVYGHVDIPDNSHWDPGSFDYPRFFARVQAAIDREDEDMAYADFERGVRDNRKGNPKDPNGNADYDLGWALVSDIKQAKTLPEPGTPAPHEHNLQGKAT